MYVYTHTCIFLSKVFSDTAKRPQGNKPVPVENLHPGQAVGPLRANRGFCIPLTTLCRASAWQAGAGLQGASPLPQGGVGKELKYTASHGDSHMGSVVSWTRTPILPVTSAAQLTLGKSLNLS